MKNLLLFCLIIVSWPVFGQDYKVIRKITKNCSTIFDGEHFGLLYDGKIVQKMEYSECESGNHVILFSNEFSSVGWKDNGNLLLRIDDATLSFAETMDYILAIKKSGDQSLYDLDGQQMIPFGHYEFEFYEEGVLVKSDEKGYGYFDQEGKAILPLSDKKIFVLDDYWPILSVKEDGVERVFLYDDWMTLPYRFSQFSDYAFVQNHEVTIEEYLYFLGSLQETGDLLSSEASQAITLSDLLPDTNKVEEKLRPLYRYAIPLLLSEDYTTYPTNVMLTTKHPQELYMSFQLDKVMKNLAQFPVTGITKAQAEAYCQWLSIMSAEYIGYDTYEAHLDYRLPTPQEWEVIASAGLNENCKYNGVPDSLSEDGCMMFVYHSSAQCKNYSDYLKVSKGGGTIPSLDVPIDFKGRHQIFGNVAEMTSQNGVAKGGSYAESAKAANLKNNIPYLSPEPWLGFRIVGEYRY